MKIKTLQISNILSFKYHENIENAEKITFEDDLNIIIGENGSGKSTALEVINFLFRRVLYKQYTVNHDLYAQRNSILADQRRQTLLPVNNNSYSGFRLDSNWSNGDGNPQVIRIEVELDDIDKKNINNLISNFDKLSGFAGRYSTRATAGLPGNSNTYVLDITLHKSNQNFSIALSNGSSDFGYEYLTEYNFYKESIAFYNLENSKEPMGQLYESFTLISSYRNYNAFVTSIGFNNQHPSQLIQTIKNSTFNQSLNTHDSNEPSIFGLVRLRVAEEYYKLNGQKYSDEECEEKANKLPFITRINEKIKAVNLKCMVKLVNKVTWQFSFEFLDLRRQKTLSDINSLSAGQKAIIHLVFEAYGREDLKGGLVIIDEPEIHLHYQFQNEYLQVIKELNKEQSCQYVLVTHSEALINSSTINQVKRFSLSQDGYTEIKAPKLTNQQKMLIKILDNTRSTYAFFAKKVLLVEGETDKYFYRSVILEKYPQLDQSIAVLCIDGKHNYEEWRSLFHSFGLEVYFIADFDFSIQRFYPAEKSTSLKSQSKVNAFKTKYLDWEAKIKSEYKKNIFILKNGDLEHYLSISPKGLPKTIEFCNNELKVFLASKTEESKELKNILNRITK